MPHSPGGVTFGRLSLRPTVLQVPRHILVERPSRTGPSGSSRARPRAGVDRSWPRRARRARGAVVWLAAGLTIPGALLSGALAPAAASPAGTRVQAVAEPGSPSTALLTTPLLSPARLPETMQDLAASRRLGAAVASAMSARSLGATAAASSCAEVAQDGRVLYQDHADLAVIPASNMKLVTATALLDKLGPSYTFQTDLKVLQKPVHGVVHGNLYLVGGGDPVLRLSSDAPSGPRPRTRTWPAW